MTSTNTDENQIVLSNGVVFELNEFPREQIARINQKIHDEYPEPVVPLVWIEDQGREEPNASDPDYLTDLTTWQIRLTDRVVGALCFDALELVHKPEDLPGPDSPEFRDFLKIVHNEEPFETPRARYVQWVQYRAIPGKDMMYFSRRLLQLAGVPEEDVRVIEATFRSEAGGQSDSRNATDEPSENRD